MEQIIVAAIIAIVTQLLEEKGGNRGAVAHCIRNPGIRGTLRVRRHLRQQGLRGAELNAAVGDVLEAARQATNEEVDALIEECCDMGS